MVASQPLSVDELAVRRRRRARAGRGGAGAPRRALRGGPQRDRARARRRRLRVPGLARGGRGLCPAVRAARRAGALAGRARDARGDRVPRPVHAARHRAHPRRRRGFGRRRPRRARPDRRSPAATRVAPSATATTPLFERVFGLESLSALPRLDDLGGTRGRDPRPARGARRAPPRLSRRRPSRTPSCHRRLRQAERPWTSPTRPSTRDVVAALARAPGRRRLLGRVVRAVQGARRRCSSARSPAREASSSPRSTSTRTGARAALRDPEHPGGQGLPERPGRRRVRRRAAARRPSRTFLDGLLGPTAGRAVLEELARARRRDGRGRRARGRRPRAALELLLARRAATADEGRRDEIRRRMVALFAELGQDARAQPAYRRRLAATCADL